MRYNVVVEGVHDPKCVRDVLTELLKLKFPHTKVEVSNVRSPIRSRRKDGKEKRH